MEYILIGIALWVVFGLAFHLCSEQHFIKNHFSLFVFLSGPVIWLVFGAWALYAMYIVWKEM